MQKKLTKIEKREADETAALENMVQMVEKNLELTTVCIFAFHLYNSHSLPFSLMLACYLVS